MMALVKNLLSGVQVEQMLGSSDVEIASIHFNSKHVQPRSMFVAIYGTERDGHSYIEEAIKKGALAIVCQELPLAKHTEVCYIQVNHSSKALGWIASNFYGHPSKHLKLVGVTGTNGKTSVSTLLFKLFRELGYKVGLISTIQNQIDAQVVETIHTTPDALSVNKLLKSMVDRGCAYCFMEVSSHAISQARIAGLNFVGGIFTNLSHEHLDYHQSFAAYLQAKKAFFDGLSAEAFALTNADDKNGLVMLQNTKAAKRCYALKTMADYKARILENNFNGLLLDVDHQEVWCKLVGTFNAYNLLAVYAAAILLQQDRFKVLTVLSKLEGPEGRFELFISRGGIVGVVDYAHTPDAVYNVLNAIHEIRKGNEQIITIIGCGGDRDKAKRPLMAKIAGSYSDKVILTSDNPRSEDPGQIIREMEAGIPTADYKKYVSIIDRKEAIEAACRLAKAGDIILLAGKGHEKYQEVGGKKYAFLDKHTLMQQLKAVS